MTGTHTIASPTLIGIITVSPYMGTLGCIVSAFATDQFGTPDAEKRLEESDQPWVTECRDEVALTFALDLAIPE